MEPGHCSLIDAFGASCWRRGDRSGAGPPRPPLRTAVASLSLCGLVASAVVRRWRPAVQMAPRVLLGAHSRILLAALSLSAAALNVVVSESMNPADVLSTTELLATGVS